MKIYIAGAIKGDISYQKYYKEVVDHVIETGHTAYSELNKELFTSQKLTDKEIFTRDIRWIEDSELMIAEISGPSLGVGFEISFALSHLKLPVLALFCNDAGTVSAMITGCTSDLLTVKSYTSSADLIKIIEDFISRYKSS